VSGLSSPLSAPARRGRSLPATPATVLIVGSGGREHALAWRLAGEPGVRRVLVAPGNPLMWDVAEVITDLPPSDHAALVDLCRTAGVDLVVVGPEAPLVEGLADTLAAAGISCLGPRAQAARLEASKSFCREVAEAAGVPMAEGAGFVDAEAAVAYARSLGAPLVVKADGLAAGKGVTVCDTLGQAEAAISEAMLGGRFGVAGRQVVVERRLSGVEASLIALSDGHDAILLPPARDHKRLLDGDAGPNTGGMGAYSPLPDLPQGQAVALLERIHRPVLAEMRRRGVPFHGFLYAGLMLTAEGPRLLEFNVRLGDPEAQAILPALDAPLARLMHAAVVGRLRETAIALGMGDLLPTRGAAVALTLAAPGYPDEPRIGHPIEGLDDARAAGGLVFGAGLALSADGQLVAAGGRVLTVVGRGVDTADARAAAYEVAARVRFEGCQLRSDIAAGPAVPPGARSAAAPEAAVA
jgi:phosphoribosylamine---glycine ligase